MSLLAQIKQDQLSARKAKESLKATLLTTLIGEATSIGKNDGNRDSTDAEVTATIKKFIKNINELLSVTQSDSAVAEKAILEQYLPNQLSEEQLQILIEGIVITCSADTPTGPIRPKIGDVVKRLKAQYDGQYDGAVASRIIKAVLQ